MKPNDVIQGIRDRHTDKSVPSLADARVAAKAFSDALAAQEEFEIAISVPGTDPEAQNQKDFEIRQQVANTGSMLFRLLRKREIAGEPIVALSRETPSDNPLLTMAREMAGR